MTYDLCAIGNALVDVIVQTDDAFLIQNNIVKGAMTLVDEARAAALYDKAGAVVEMASGGSAANTLAGFAFFGGKGAFQGKVGADETGRLFAHDLRAQGVHFTTAESPHLPTGRSLIFVTPDAQRSMNTSLGAAVAFGSEDVDAAVIQDAAITYLEGYLFDKPQAQDAFRQAAKLAHKAGRMLALTLSDSFCVLRHRAAFLDLVANEVDLLFSNEAEMKALYDTEDSQAALDKARAHTQIAVMTRGAKGVTVASGATTHTLPAHPVSSVVDTTGAGDLFAAGFLYGVTQGRTVTDSAYLGTLAASEIISHYGSRPQKK